MSYQDMPKGFYFTVVKDYATIRVELRQRVVCWPFSRSLQHGYIYDSDLYRYIYRTNKKEDVPLAEAVEAKKHLLWEAHVQEKRKAQRKKRELAAVRSELKQIRRRR